MVALEGISEYIDVSDLGRWRWLMIPNGYGKFGSCNGSVGKGRRPSSNAWDGMMVFVWPLGQTQADGSGRG